MIWVRSQEALGAVFTQKTDQHLDFRSSSFQLARQITLFDKARGQILIHEELAKKNKLKVGDSLTLSSSQMETPAKEQTFKIVGIFQVRNRVLLMTLLIWEENRLPYEVDATKLLVSVSKK